MATMCAAQLSTFRLNLAVTLAEHRHAQLLCPKRKWQELSRLSKTLTHWYPAAASKCCATVVSTFDAAYWSRKPPTSTLDFFHA